LFREGAAAADRNRRLPWQAALVLRRCRDEKDECEQTPIASAIKNFLMP
jgi:hypothetical protein